MKFIPASIVLIAVCAFAAFAQKPTPTPTVAKGPTYDELLAKLKGGDTAIDYRALRFAFTQTKDYSPYGGGDERKAATALLGQKKYKDAVKKAEEILKDDYVDMEAHVIASTAYRELKNDSKADFHKAVYLGLMNSILTSGDGKTTKTAYVVITTHEEYIVLRALELFPGGQSLVHQEGHSFDVQTVTDPKTNESRKIFFNIDIVWKKETDMFM